MILHQIWHALEHDHYLTAARLYLIAKVVYKNLQAEQEDMTFTVEVGETVHLKTSYIMPRSVMLWFDNSHFICKIDNISCCTAAVGRGQSFQDPDCTEERPVFESRGTIRAGNDMALTHDSV